jgi:hypothetical protein
MQTYPVTCFLLSQEPQDVHVKAVNLNTKRVANVASATSPTERARVALVRRPGSAPLLRQHTRSDLAARAELLWATDDGSDADEELGPESPSRSSLRRTRRHMHARSAAALQSATAASAKLHEAQHDTGGIPAVPARSSAQTHSRATDQNVPMLGYKMTVAMMQELVNFMKVIS